MIVQLLVLYIYINFFLDIGSQSSFQMTCDLRRDQPVWTLARVHFYSEEPATVRVTCTTTDVS